MFSVIAHQVPEEAPAIFSILDSFVCEPADG